MIGGRGGRPKGRRLALGAALAVVTVGIATAAAVASAVEHMQDRAPTAALALDANDPAALVRAVDMRIQETRQLPKADVLRRAGVDALRGAPLSAGGIRLVAIGQQASGREDKSRKLIELASRVSRRDFGSQLLLIETSVQQGDIRKALEHYDIALRTNKSAENLLFPILADAIEDPAVRLEFRPLIRSGAPWVGSFLGYASRAGGHARIVAAAIFEAGGIEHLTGREDIKSALLQSLAVERQFGQLSRIYGTMRGARKDVLTAAGFNDNTTRQVWAPVAWSTVTAAPLSAGFQGADRNARSLDLQVSLNAGEELIVARKLLYLRPGSYRFRGALEAAAWPAESNVRWILKCAMNAAEPAIWTGYFTGQGANKTTVGDFSVANCPVQYLDLVALSGTGQTPLDFVVKSPDLQPVAGPSHS